MQAKTTCLSIAVLSAALLAGCAHRVSFTSEPTGATVSYNGQTIGTTPFEWTVADQFGWFSVYSFRAELEGYFPTTLSYEEKLPTDAEGVVPDHVNFVLLKLTPDAEALPPEPHFELVKQ